MTTFVVCNKYGPPMSSANKPYQKLYFLDARELGETFSPGYLSFANLRTLSTRTTVKQNFKFNKQNVQVLGSVCYNNHIFLINSISLKKMPYIMPKLHRQNNVWNKMQVQRCNKIVCSPVSFCIFATGREKRKKKNILNVFK